MASTPSRRSPSAGRASEEGGGSGDGRGGNARFRLFGAWIQGPRDDVANHGGDVRQEVQWEGEDHGKYCAAMAGAESSHHGHPARRHHGPARRPKRRATPWTVEEHRDFLLGLEKMGRGKWAAIAKEFVKTRNKTEVASHAQKHFLRQQKAAAGIKPRRLSIFRLDLDAEEDGDHAAGAGNVEAPQPPTPLLWPDPNPQPPPALEKPHGGPSSPSPPQRIPSVREIAPRPQPPGLLLFGVGAAPPSPMPHLATVPHAAVPAAFHSSRCFKFDMLVAPWPTSAWAPLWPIGPYFAAHGQQRQHHHHYQQELASTASSSLSQDSEEDGTNLGTEA